MLLKSPNHTFRIHLLRSLFPRATFIWMGRPTAEVLASNLRMWRAMMGLYALWECPHGALENFLQAMLAACSSTLAECLDAIPRERMLWVDFSDLRSNPRRVLERVVRFVEGGSAMSAPMLRKLDAAAAAIPIHAAATEISSADPIGQTGQRLESLMVSARQKFGGIASADRISIG